MNPIPHRIRKRGWLYVAIAIIIALVFFLTRGHNNDEQTAVAHDAALTVQAVNAKIQNWPETIQASGAIAAWQEAIIGSEISGQRLVEVLVNVGDRVKKGQVLARFNTDTLRAQQAELQAAFQQAESDSKRAGSLKDSGALSGQQIQDYTNQASIAKARLDAANLQLQYATITAPDDGTISSRTATLGAIANAGSELFRMILQDRIEWRGELNAEQLTKVKIGQVAALILPDGSAAKAVIRQLSPSLDPATRMAIAYADIAPGVGCMGTRGLSHARAGMYASGTIEMEMRRAVTVPALSVVIRDGHSYVFTIGNDASNTRVTQQVVKTGRHQGTDVEITVGLKEGARVVTQGAGFLNDGDKVRLVRSLP